MSDIEQQIGVKNEIKSWIERGRGIVGFFGEIDSEIDPTWGVQISLAAGEHIADREIKRVVFDFTNANFFDSGLLTVLVTTHKLTLGAGLKEMSLRNITDPNIRKLLERTGLDGAFVIEEEDEIDGTSPKMSWRRNRSPNLEA